MDDRNKKHQNKGTCDCKEKSLHRCLAKVNVGMSPCISYHHYYPFLNFFVIVLVVASYPDRLQCMREISGRPGQSGDVHLDTVCVRYKVFMDLHG